MPGWVNSTRRQRLPGNWSTQVAPTILRRDPVCRCQGCPHCTPTGCPRPSTEVDHLTPGDNHNPTNLAGKCTPCHSHKSGQEGAHARARKYDKRCPPEPHPTAPSTNARG